MKTRTGVEPCDCKCINLKRMVNQKCSYNDFAGHTKVNTMEVHTGTHRDRNGRQLYDKSDHSSDLSLNDWLKWKH